MNTVTYTTFDEDWIQAMKKEIFESVKEKEAKYNFDFDKEQIKPGRLVWEKLEISEKQGNPSTL
jgi:Cyclin-dependent kinase inhibitor